MVSSKATPRRIRRPAISRSRTNISISAKKSATALRKLRMLNNAKVLQDLAVPPNNQLEALKGDRGGTVQHPDQ